MKITSKTLKKTSITHLSTTKKDFDNIVGIVSHICENYGIIKGE